MGPFAVDGFDARIAQGLINAAPDPSGSGLTLYNYTPRCQFEAAWDDYTLAARGLVLDSDGTVVARPFRKFFNLGEARGQPKPGHPELFEKYDGSLIIAFFDGQRWRCNTRGSWTSHQARAAAAWLQPVFGANTLTEGATWLFEYVAPTNRVIVPYDDERCVLLGVIDNESAREWSRASIHEAATATGLEVARSHGVQALHELALTGGDGMREGFVAVWPCGHRVKLKFAEYLRLHRLRTGLSVRGIWQELADGGDMIDGKGLPDEFMDWYRQQRDDLQAAFAEQSARVQTVFSATREHLKNADRKAYALHWQTDRALPKWMLGALFRLLDNRPCDDLVWRAIHPTDGTAGSTLPL